ncbi:HEAT repeat domain-containing protein [Virgisporangium aurantiacum]|uniref:HEAT repeat domain-containing protein n=1 Tax=Virgisporangium aurantiacum TaxID=175570 RepID=UPI00194F2F10|nr:HEAT repeat domain-containing protein [Virgisporangium aurantiacum]
MATWRERAGDPRGVDELVRVALAEFDLSDEELRSATGALVALQFRPTREVLDRACELCRSADADERRLGVRVLGELRDLDDPAAALPAFVGESMEVLLALAATEPDTDVLIEVARAFGYRRDPRAVEPLLGWRRHEDPSIRFFVACSLRRCSTQDNEAQVVDALIELTGDEDGAVRDYALFGLRELEVDSAEVRDAMLRRVRDPDDSAAGEALVGLARLGDERAVAPLIERLQHPDSHRIIAYGLDAAIALANPRLLPALRLVEQRLGERPDVSQAIKACTEGR